MQNKNQIPSLASVMSRAAQQITNRGVSGDSLSKNWAEIRLAKGVGASTPKTAQYSGGMANNSVTQPNFYSPFLTPSSFQVPNTRKEVYLWANWWRNNEPKVAAAINFYTNFPFNGWKLECKSGVVKDYFEKLLKKLNFEKYLPLISYSYHLYGDAFVLTEIDCQKCEGTMVDPETGEKCQHPGATWKSISLLNPDSVSITPGFISSDPLYAYIPSDREIKIVNEGRPREIFDQIPEVVKMKIRQKMPIPLDPLCIYHFKHGADYWADYGTSLVRPLFTTLAYKDKLRQAQWIISERYIIPTKIVKVGDDNRPASQSDLDSVQDQLAAVANDPNLTLVTPHSFSYEFVGAQGGILDVKGEFDQLSQEILDGLMINKALLNGEGPSYSTAQVGLLSMNERLESWRREVARWIEEVLFKNESKWNGFWAKGEGGQDELIYPRIIFDPLKLKDNVGTLQTLVTAQQNGVISAETLVEEFGLNWDQEVERLRFEQGLNFVNSPEVMNTDMNIGFGGVSGNGFGAGLNQPLTPGAAPAGGDFGAPMGGDLGAPPADMGAAAPAPAPEPPAPAATAAQIHTQYRFASQLMNEIYFNQKTFSELNSTEYLSEVDKEINQKLAVTGRSYVGEIPDDLEPVEPWNVPFVGVPMNYAASQGVRYSKVKEKKMLHGYTGLEKKLYQIIMSLNLPYAFYAQFESGPGKAYVLDGAFPDIKLAVEADGEIWHNNPNKIQSDKDRDISLSRQGWTVLRFTDKEIEKQPRDVAMVIKQAISKLAPMYENSFKIKNYIL